MLCAVSDLLKKTGMMRYCALALVCTVVVALMPSVTGRGLQLVAPANAADMLTIGDHETSRIVKLGLNKSMIVRLPEPARDVLISGPTIVDAVVRTARTVYLMGRTVGQTNVFFFDAEGRQILSLEVAVERDVEVLEQTLRRLIPGGDINVEALNDSFILTGTVSSAQQSRMAMDIAARFAVTGDGVTVEDHDGVQRVVNLLTIAGRDQVMLKVTVGGDAAYCAQADGC